MYSIADRFAIAADLVWLGMVLAISFMEAPLKFRAPGLELKVGLGIGRIVFRALNTCEAVLAAVLALCAILGSRGATVYALALVTVVLLAIQLGIVRPWLNRKSDKVLSGDVDPEAPRSHAHLVYVALELIKVVLLVALACYLLG